MTPEEIARLRTLADTSRDARWVAPTLHDELDECLDEIERLHAQLSELETAIAEAYDDADGWQRTAKRLASKAGASCSDFLEPDESEGDNAQD
jgi:uncharacterized coiled-coil DUF342 family protein